ncbi:MAG: hypothetical protein Q7K33_03375 [Candidatus Berkelbacteria bacterium]|nr:hypothetical protein [Candidatus Berkelbacteria bacterium]
MGRIKEFLRSVWYWICVQFQPFDEITARELKFVDDVERYCDDSLLVETDEEESCWNFAGISRVAEIQRLANKHRDNVRRSMTARVWAVLTGDWETFQSRALRELETGMELMDKTIELRRRYPTISARHMGADSKITIPMG